MKIEFPSYNLVQKIINERLDHDLLAISNPGSSGSRVYIMRNYDTHKLYAVKCTKNPRVDLSEEKERRDALAAHYGDHLPRVILVTAHDDVQIMVSECNATDTLFSMVSNGTMSHGTLASIWSSAVQKIEQVWVNGKHEFNLEASPRNYQTRAQRISDGVEHFLNSAGVGVSALNKPLRIDGIEYSPLSAVIAKASGYTRPKYGVVCHGDPNPSNIVVDDNKKWHLVDWEWSGAHHDWRGMVSHLYGWWMTRHCSALETPEITCDGKILDIKTGDVVQPQYIEKYTKPVKEMFRRVSQGELGTEHDLEQTSKFLTLLYLGEVRFAPLWNREVVIPHLFKLAAIEHTCSMERPQMDGAYHPCFASDLTRT